MLTISRHVLRLQNEPQLDEVFIIVLSKFPHYWVFWQRELDEYGRVNSKQISREVGFFLLKYVAAT